MSTSTSPAPAETFYDTLGGEQTITRLVDAFYAGVADDPVLRPMYPADDLGPANERLRLFFIQLFGGPTTYTKKRGHPCLPSLHAPFKIGTEARDAWLRRMRSALDSLALADDHDRAVWNYMQRVADDLRNTAG